MTEISRAEQMANRLMAIDWADSEGAVVHDGSRVALMREYLRRTALWAHEYRIDGDWPFIDLAARVDPEVRADPVLLARMEDALDDRATLLYAQKTSRHAVHWAALLDARADRLPPLEDPFEPIVLLFERGGLFGTEGRAADFALGMIQYRTRDHYLAVAPIESLDPDLLDKIDDEGWARFERRST